MGFKNEKWPEIGLFLLPLHKTLAQNLDKMTQICYNDGVKIELDLDQFLLKFFANSRANLLEVLK
jgi:hypothetical protein